MRALRRRSLTQWIFVAMLLGAGLGVAFPDGERALHGGFAASDLKLLSDLFIRMIKMIIAPILFATLIVGIAGTATTSSGWGGSRSGPSSTSRS